MTGQILWGSNGIYSVEVPRIGEGGTVYECRLKGKKLAVAGEEYNPLAPGDLVEIEAEGDSGRGMIAARLDRRRWLERWNQKRNAPQVIVSNVDLLVVVACVQSPPFRPRFVDRCLVAAALRGIPALLAVNKVDLGIDDQDGARILHYQRMGYPVVLCSVELGEGIEALRTAMAGKLVALVGQSGVGKSSLLTTLAPGVRAKVGRISGKYNRGTHTTVLARSYGVDFARGLIDTPGIRGLELTAADPAELAACFPDFAEFAPGCGHYNCRHLDEPDCAVRRAAAEGRLPADRYESYCRIVGGQGE